MYVCVTKCLTIFWSINSLEFKGSEELGTRNPVPLCAFTFNMAAWSTYASSKRKRGPYLSCLTNPLHHEVPRVTHKFCSREVREGNIGEKRDESCSQEFTTSSQNRESDFHSDDAGCSYIGTENFVAPQHEGRKNETLIMIEEGTSIVDEQAYCINFPEAFDNGAENAEAYKTNETTAEMSSHVTNVEEPAFDMYSPEELEIETNIILDITLLIYLMVKQHLLMTVRRKHAWEELLENDENVEETTDDHQENPLGEGKEKPLYHGARITLGVSLLLIITFVIRHQLSGTALMDLLTLIDIHLIAPYCFTRSLATLHKFFKQLENPLQFHYYYCSFCYRFIGICKRTSCTNKHCLQHLKKKNYYIYYSSL